MQDVKFQQIQIAPAFQSPQFQLSQSDQNTLSKTICRQDIELVQKEIAQITKFSQGASTILSKLNKSKLQCSQRIDSLHKESSQLEENINDYQNSLNSNAVKLTQNQIQSNKKRYIALWEERISISEQLNIKKIQEIQIEDRKSLANQLFKWIVVAIYAENQTKFYLPNFKLQLFQKDGGKDFKERLGKINASNAKEEQIVKAKDFLSKYSEIIECEEIQDAKTEAETLKKVAQIFIECHDLAKKSLELEKSIEKEKEESLKKDEEAMKWKARHEALQERIEVVGKHLDTLKHTEMRFKEQQKSHENKLTILQLVMSKLRKGEALSETELETLAEA